MFDEKETRRLRKRIGNFERVTFEYKDLTPGFAEWVTNMLRRRGEVVMVVPRGGGRVLLHTKPHYPHRIYRLPTGGIHPREAAERAAKRETYEELGFRPELLKLLGILNNVFYMNGKAYPYPSFVFETEEYRGAPAPKDTGELISGFAEADRVGLRAVAQQLANLSGPWREWGAFRAASHAWLAERL